MVERFFRESQWRPTRAQPVAGALLYRQYNFFIRWVMKRIARHEGGSTDTSRDHVYTNWEALDAFAREFAAGIAPVAVPPRPRPPAQGSPRL